MMCEQIKINTADEKLPPLYIISIGWANIVVMIKLTKFIVDSDFIFQ